MKRGFQLVHPSQRNTATIECHAPNLELPGYLVGSGQRVFSLVEVAKVVVVVVVVKGIKLLKHWGMQLCHCGKRQGSNLLCCSGIFFNAQQIIFCFGFFVVVFFL